METAPVTLSVTITSYNYEEFIGRAIESVLKQTFTDFELIIVDDASTDSSVEIIKKYAKQDTRIRLISHNQTRGATPSLIEACNLAKGKYLVNIDSDDWITATDAFALQIEKFKADPEIVLVYSPQVMYKIEQDQYHVRAPYNHDNILAGHLAIEKVMAFFLAHTGTMVSKAAYQKVGGYNSRYRYAIDLQLWIDLCKEGKIAYINKKLYIYNVHSGSLSHSADPDLWQNELLDCLNSGFVGPRAFSSKEKQLIQRKLFKRALVAGPLHYVFNDNYRFGWQLFFSSFKKHPVDTLLQKATIVLLFRTVLQEPGYRRFQKLVLKQSVKVEKAA